MVLVQCLTKKNLLEKEKKKLVEQSLLSLEIMVRPLNIDWPSYIMSWGNSIFPKEKTLRGSFKKPSFLLKTANKRKVKIYILARIKTLLWSGGRASDIDDLQQCFWLNSGGSSIERHRKRTHEQVNYSGVAT